MRIGLSDRAKRGDLSSPRFVKLFDYVIVDDAGGSILGFISTTGEYRLFFDCRKGLSLSGQGQVTLTGCKAELRDLGSNPKSPDRNVFALANSCTRSGTATVVYAAEPARSTTPTLATTSTVAHKDSGCCKSMKSPAISRAQCSLRSFYVTSPLGIFVLVG
jgi:hypothetical protein